MERVFVRIASSSDRRGSGGFYDAVTLHVIQRQVCK